MFYGFIRLIPLFITLSATVKSLIGDTSDATDTTANVGRRLNLQQKLINHSTIFNTPTIHQVTDRVYVAIGYALSNMILINGTDGVVVIDTTENSESAMAIMRDFRNLVTDQPIKGIIITHFHKDHVAGANALIADSTESQVRVFAHCTFADELKNFHYIIQAGWRRTKRQVGQTLNDIEHINSGIGPKLFISETYDLDPIATDTFCDNMTFTLAGMDFELFHTPGETNDQITIWMPDKRVAFPGDNIYYAFPNIYPIRGATARDAVKWFNSLDKVINLQPEYLVPSHTQALAGRDRIQEVLTSYRDAIQFVHDQTVRHINKGTPLDDMVQLIKLPENLRNHEYLQEFYGSVEWSVRGIYEFYMGWFDEDPVSLFPLSKTQEAQFLVRLIGENYSAGTSGITRMLLDADKSLEAMDDLSISDEDAIIELRWALKLSSLVYKICDLNYRTCQRAKLIQDASMKGLASMTLNANARNYYLTFTKEMVSTESDRSKQQFVENADFDNLMMQLPIRFNAERCESDTYITGRMEFDLESDNPYVYSVLVRNCVLIMKRTDPSDQDYNKYDFRLTTKSETWRYSIIRNIPWSIYYTTKLFTESTAPIQFLKFLKNLQT